MKIITGNTVDTQVTADDDRSIYAGIIGTATQGLDVNDNLSYQLISNTQIRISSGNISIQGTQARINHGEYEDITIPSGATGYYRKDLVVARYTNAEGVENVELTLIQGQASTTQAEAVIPSYNQGSILGGDLIVDMPLYQIDLNGLNVSKITKMFDTLHSLNDLSHPFPDVIRVTQYSYKDWKTQKDVEMKKGWNNYAFEIPELTDSNTFTAYGKVYKISDYYKPVGVCEIYMEGNQSQTLDNGIVADIPTGGYKVINLTSGADRRIVVYAYQDTDAVISTSRVCLHFTTLYTKKQGVI